MEERDEIQVDWNLLMEKFINNTCTKDEFDQLMLKLKEEKGDDIFLEKLDATWDSLIIERDVSEIDWNEKYQSLMEGASAQEKPSGTGSSRLRFFLFPLTVAAAFLLVFVSAYLVLNRSSQREIAQTKALPEKNKQAIIPGGNKAYLTLGDGSTMVLDNLDKGTSRLQGNTKFTKIDDGKLVYNTSNSKSPKVLFNTISTPKGGEYEVVLSDGTKVWLNAASNLRFPTSFEGKERNVVLDGEGYFEVTLNKLKPFTVSLDGVKVEVLGTHFNVNGYKDEGTVKTTLLEGSVKITNKIAQAVGSKSVVIQPGQRAHAGGQGEIEIVKNIDVEEAVAWKKGFFRFKNTDIPTIMRQVSRWYDVDVIYTAGIPKKKFTGKINKKVGIDQLIKMLAFAQLQLKIEGRKIIVSK